MFFISGYNNLFSNLIFLGFTIWIYFDLKKIRQGGIKVNPGLIAGLFLIGSYALSAFLFFGSRFYYSNIYYSILYSLPGGPGLIILAIGVGGYFILRARLKKKISLDNPPLPPAPRWGKWFFAGIIFLPLILLFLLIFIFARLFGGSW